MEQTQGVDKSVDMTTLVELPFALCILTHTYIYMHVYFSYSWSA